MEFLCSLEMIKKPISAKWFRGSRQGTRQRQGQPPAFWGQSSHPHLGQCEQCSPEWVITNLLKLFLCVNCCLPSSSCQNPPLGNFSGQSDPDAGGCWSLGPPRGCCTRLLTWEDVLHPMKMKQLGKTWKLGFKPNFSVVITNFLNFLAPAGSSWKEV